MRGMRRSLALLALSVALGVTPGCATAPPPPRQQAESPSLDALFTRLRNADSAEEASYIETAIRRQWARSGRTGVDALMGRAVESIHNGNYPQALSALDRVTATAPDYAEGWNLRATVHYLREEYGPALGDIERVLALEPRHFGALAGLGRILVELNDKKAALQAYEAALSINPHLDQVREESEELREELAGIPI